MTLTTNNNFLPLADAELDEIDHFLLKEVEDDEAMLLDSLDGYLHAIAVGPITMPVSQWMPAIWGSAGAMVPAGKSMAESKHLLSLVLRHFNDILENFKQDPIDLATVWGVNADGGREYADAQGWARGFVNGMKLCWPDWAPLLDTPQGQAWYRPIALLGDQGYSAEQEASTSTPAKRDKLAQQIPDGVVAMQKYWRAAALG